MKFWYTLWGHSAHISLNLGCSVIIHCGVNTLNIYEISKLGPNNFSFSKNDEAYYENVGQSFTHDQYFYSRPSAVRYNVAGSGGSNKGTSNPDYLAEVHARIDTFMGHNPEIRKVDILSDKVTARGCGIDLHIQYKAQRCK